MSEWTDSPEPIHGFSEEVPRVQEFQADFEQTLRSASDLSTTQLPDAISFDFGSAFSEGPVALGDTSEGIAEYAWRARVEGTSIYLSRAEAGSWGSETLLFDAGANPARIGLAFEFSARPIVSLEINGDLWIYFFDSSIDDFALTNFGVGRGCQAIYDSLYDSAGGDGQVFYLRADDRLCHRQQRDRFTIEYETPYVGVDATTLLGVARTENSRLVVILAQRESGSGTYSLDRLESQVFPWIAEEEAFDFSGSPLDGRLQDWVTESIETLDLLGVPTEGLLRDQVQLYLVEEDIDLTGIPIAGVLDEIIEFFVATNEPLDLLGAPQSGTLIVVAFVHTATNEPLDLTGVPTSGTLV